MTDSFSREALYAHAAQIAAHPGFAAAKARHTHVGLDVVDGKPVVAKLACQISRYATLAMILCYYDLAESGNAQGGVTSSTVLAAIGRTPFASRSWAKLMVRVYHRAGMIAYDPHGPDRRARPFHPTPELLAMGQQAIGIFFEALALVDALPGDPAELAQRPGVLTGMARALVDTYFKHRFTMLEASPEIGALFKREFGYLIFAHLVQTMQTDAAGSRMPRRRSAICPSAMAYRAHRCATFSNWPSSLGWSSRSARAATCWSAPRASWRWPTTGWRSTSPGSAICSPARWRGFPRA